MILKLKHLIGATRVVQLTCRSRPFTSLGWREAHRLGQIADDDWNVGTSSNNPLDPVASAAAAQGSSSSFQQVQTPYPPPDQRLAVYYA